MDDSTDHAWTDSELAARVQAQLDAAGEPNIAIRTQVRALRPVLTCVEQTGPSTFNAHFGYANTSAAILSVPVGFFNRFWPGPIARSQPTTFAPGAQPDVVRVPFSRTGAVAWILGVRFDIATPRSPPCPVSGTGGTMAAGGSGGRGIGGGGGGGGAAGAGGGAGGTGGQGVCPSTCDDRNPCTIDICTATTGFQCSHLPTLDGTPCSDGNACTVDDVCSAGRCVPGPTKVCVSSGPCHVAGTCDPGTGACSNPAAIDSTPCDDGNLCTFGDVCHAGVCSGTPASCVTIDPCRAGGICDAATGRCSNGPPKPDGAPCAELANSCTPSPICLGGVCQAGISCPAVDACHLPGCVNPATGACSNRPAPDGTACNDFNACTIGDTCQSGVCTGGAPVPCVAADQCHTAGTCDPGSGQCSNPVASAGTPCNDANLCTKGDACSAGVCVPGTPLNCVITSQLCTAFGGCNPTTGTCLSGPAATSAGSGPAVSCAPTDDPPTDAAALRVYRLTQSEQHAQLARVVGQYACGDSPLYRGTFAAGDNFGEAQPGGALDGILTSGPVIASLEPMGTSQVFLSCTRMATGGRALTVMGTTQPRAIRLFQPTAEASTTYATLINEPQSGWSGTAGSCTGCVADWRSGSPPAIAISPATFIGQYCVSGLPPLTVTAQGQLELLASPSFDDITAINQKFGDREAAPPFSPQGADMVATVSGVVVEPASPPSASCRLMTPYHVDWYVRQQDVTIFGLRNFRVDSPFLGCCQIGGI